ncbi:MAG: DUF4375 domain-containing protein [Kofleriaceae bacterium]|nr:DUF4375 domain-containing protein [Kofleriaceae bacterium]
MPAMTSVIVSQGSFASDDPYDLINSNLTVVNLLREEGYPPEQLPAAARASYWVDFYRAQMSNGGFPQLVYNARWDATVVAEIEAGLALMGAAEHLALFRTLAARVAALPADELAAFLRSNLFGPNPTRDLLRDDAYFALARQHDLVAIGHAFLRGLPDLRVLSIDDMFAALEQVLGRPIAR